MRYDSENELILRCARRSELRSLLQQQINWDYLFATAQAHGLLPLLHKHLTSVAGDLVPGHFLSRLKRESVANSQNVLHLIGKFLARSKCCRAIKTSISPAWRKEISP